MKKQPFPHHISQITDCMSGKIGKLVGFMKITDPMSAEKDQSLDLIIRF